MVNTKTLVYADLGDLQKIKKLNKDSFISGFTTNPTILKKNKIRNYEQFIVNTSSLVFPKPISIEVISDNPKRIIQQAEKIASIRENIYIKIPVMNSKGRYLYDVIKDLSLKKLNLNITAVMTKKQISAILKNISVNKTIISIFAGRIADTGLDPVETIKFGLNKSKKYKNIKILWASPREVLNYYQACNVSCDIITMTPDLISKIKLKNYNLELFSRDTVKMFYKDALDSKLKI